MALIRRQVAEADGHSCKGEEVKEGEASRDAGYAEVIDNASETTFIPLRIRQSIDFAPWRERSERARRALREAYLADPSSLPPRFSFSCEAS